MSLLDQIQEQVMKQCRYDIFFLHPDGQVETVVQYSQTRKANKPQQIKTFTELKNFLVHSSYYDVMDEKIEYLKNNKLSSTNFWAKSSRDNEYIGIKAIVNENEREGIILLVHQLDPVQIREVIRHMPDTSPEDDATKPGLDISFYDDLIKQYEHHFTRYQLLFENIDEGIAYLELMGLNKNKHANNIRVLEVNPKFMEITGLKRNEVIGKTILEIVPDFDKKIIQQLHDNAFTDRISRFRRFFSKIQKHLDVTIIGSEKPHVIAIFRNVTTEENSIKQLKESEERLKILFEMAPDAYYLNDLKGNFIDGNKAAEKLIGATKENFIGKNFTKLNLLSTRQLPRAIKNMAMNVAGIPTGPDEFELSRADGGKVPVEISTFPVRIKGKSLVLGIARDISQRKKADQLIKIESVVNKEMVAVANALMESNLDNGMICDRVSLSAKKLTNSKAGFVGILEKHTKNLMVYSNQDFFATGKHDIFQIKMSGNTYPGLVGHALNTKNAFFTNEPANHSSYDAETEQMINKFIAIPAMIGETLYGLIALTKPRDAYTERDLNHLSQLASLFAIALQRKEFEQELLDAKQRAEESDRLKSTFLANMSHEIRTPMNGILGFTKLLQRPNIDEEKKSKYRKLIQDSGRGLLKLIDDIIDISKIESRQLKIEVQQVNITDLLKDLHLSFLEFRNSRDKEYIDLILDMPEEKDLVMNTDQFRLNQVFNNLLTNALKNTKTGYIKFGYRYQESGELVFFVKDSGIGIPADQQSLIFDRFAQVNMDKPRYQEGTGLGLAITKNIVELLGGNIWLESELNVGTCFYFTHPNQLVDGEIITIPRHEGSKINTLKEKVILLVEDEDMNYELIKEILQSSSLEIIRAKTGSQALDYYKQYHADIILLDIRIPDINGLEVARKIRESNTEIPIIAQTAYAMSEDRIKCLIAGCNDFIAKPIDPMKLEEVLGYYLGDRK